MKIFYINKNVLIVTTLGLILLNTLFLYDILAVRTVSYYVSVIGYCLLMLTPLCLTILFTDRVIVDKERLQSVRNFLFYKKIETIYWKDVRKINADSRLSMASNTTMGIWSDKKCVRIAISKFPLELLREILLNIPSCVPVVLDHWLKQKLIMNYGDEFGKRFGLVREEEPPLTAKIREIIIFVGKLYIGVLIIEIIMFNILGCKIKGASSLLFITGIPLFFSFVFLGNWRLMGGRWSWESPSKKLSL